MLDILLDTAGLAAAAGVVYAAAAIAIRAQWALLGGFDLSVAAAILFSAELQIALASLDFRPLSSILIGSFVSLSICAIFGAAWNFLLVRLFPRRSLAGFLLVASLGLSLAASGIVGWLRGPGLIAMQGLTTVTLPLVGSKVGPGELFASSVGAPALLLFLFWTKTRPGLSLELLSQNAIFAQEIGIERQKIAVSVGLVMGGLSGITGSYFALTSGSHPEIGLTGFLLGAGAAFFSSRKTIIAAVPGGFLIAAVQVGLQLYFSPAITNAILFGMVLVLLLTRAPNRLTENLR